MLNLLSPTFNELADAHLDITKPNMVQVQIDKVNNVIHVNVDSVCVLRICRIPQNELHFAIIDFERKVNEQRTVF